MAIVAALYCVEIIANRAPLDICQPWYFQVQIEVPLLRWRLSSSSLRTFAFKTTMTLTTAFTWCDCRWPWRYFKVIRLSVLDLHQISQERCVNGKNYYRLLMASWQWLTAHAVDCRGSQLAIRNYGRLRQLGLRVVVLVSAFCCWQNIIIKISQCDIFIMSQMSGLNFTSRT